VHDIRGCLYWDVCAVQCDGLLTVSFHHAVCFINAVSFSLSTHLSVIASSVFLVLLASIVCLSACF